MENKKNYSLSHHSIIAKINNKMTKIKKIKKGKNIIMFSKTIDGNLKLVKYFESGIIKTINKNIIVSNSYELTSIYNSFMNKIMDSTKNLEISLKKDILKQFHHSFRCINNKCIYLFCKPIKELLAHIEQCKKSICDVYYCECSKSLLEHHTACKRDKSYCEVCSPIIRTNYKI